MVKVLYIAGFGRSGSSILGNVLAQSGAVFHMGEGRNLWNDGLLLNRRCGCGKRFADCPFWNGVAASIRADPSEVVRLRNRVARTRDAIRWILPPTGAFRREVAAFARSVGEAYGAVAKVSGTRLVVDSSMSPVYGRFLMEVPQLDTKYVHLIRDPRAVANAWARPGYQDPNDQVPMRTYSLLGSGVRWAAENTLTELLLGRRIDLLRVKYEDFATRPMEIANMILDFADVPSESRPRFSDDTTVDLPVSHTVWGNPSRFLREESRFEMIADGKRKWMYIGRGSFR